MTTYAELITSLADRLNRSDNAFNAQIAQYICEAVECVEQDYTYLRMEKILMIKTKELELDDNVKAVLGASHTKKCLARQHYDIPFFMLGRTAHFETCTCCPFYVKIAKYTECDPFPADQQVPKVVRQLVNQNLNVFFNEPETFQFSELMLNRAFGTAKRADEEARYGMSSNMGTYAEGFDCCEYHNRCGYQSRCGRF